MTRTLRPGAHFRHGGFYLPNTQPGCWSVRIETRDGLVVRVLVRSAPDYMVRPFAVDSIAAAHAYLLTTPDGSPWSDPC
jgi:uncharacterized protein YbjT (DUF2867 family)